jgi:hypothetical protein
MSKLNTALLRAAVVAGLALAATTQAQAACTFGGSGEPSLQSTVNTMLSGGAPNVATECVTDGNDAGWRTVGSTGSIAVQVELAGNAGSNEFGIYDLSTGETRRIFEGNDGAGAGAPTVLAPLGSGQWRVRFREDGERTWTALNLSTSAFGFYLHSTAQGANFYSDTDRNADHADHLYAYQGNNLSTFAGGDYVGEIFGLDDYILAWDDLLAPGGDRDFQDFVAVVRDITPVPLPTAAWLLVSGLIGLTGVARRRA